MRIIDLDFYADKGGAIFLGYAGEHLSTVLNFHMPVEFSKDNCLYLVNFETDDGQVLGGSTPQESQTIGEPTADSLIAFRADRDSNIVKYYVPNTVIGAVAHTGKFQLSVYGLDVTNNNYKLLGYSTQFNYVIDNAINIGTSISFSNDFTAALDDLLSAIEGIGNFSELSEEYTDLVSRISEVLSNIEDNYEVTSNRSDDEIDYDNISASNISGEDKQKYINLYRIKELVVKIKNKISDNTTNISNLSTKIGSGSFDDSTKIGDVTPNSLMDALRKISTALTSLDDVLDAEFKGVYDYLNGGVDELVFPANTTNESQGVGVTSNLYVEAGNTYLFCDESERPISGNLYVEGHNQNEFLFQLPADGSPVAYTPQFSGYIRMFVRLGGGTVRVRMLDLNSALGCVKGSAIELTTAQRIAVAGISSLAELPPQSISYAGYQICAANFQDSPWDEGTGIILTLTSARGAKIYKTTNLACQIAFHYVSEALNRNEIAFRRKNSEGTYTDWHYFHENGRVFYASPSDFVEVIGKAVSVQDSTVYLQQGTYNFFDSTHDESYWLATATANSGHVYMGIMLSNNVHLIGLGNVVINAKYTGSNQTIRNELSIFNISGYASLENLKLVGENIEYLIHDDSNIVNVSTAYTFRMKNCVLEHNGTVLENGDGAPVCVGGGCSVGKRVVIEDCVLSSVADNRTLIYHSTLNRKTNILIKGCVFPLAGNTIHIRNMQQGTTPNMTCVIRDCALGAPLSLGLMDGITLYEYNNKVIDDDYYDDIANKFNALCDLKNGLLPPSSNWDDGYTISANGSITVNNTWFAEREFIKIPDYATSVKVIFWGVTGYVATYSAPYESAFIERVQLDHGSAVVSANYIRLAFKGNVENDLSDNAPHVFIETDDGLHYYVNALKHYALEHLNRRSGILTFPGLKTHGTTLFTNDDVVAGNLINYKFKTDHVGYFEIYTGNENNHTRIATIGKTSDSVVATEYEGTYTIPDGFYCLKVSQNIEVIYLEKELIERKISDYPLTYMPKYMVGAMSYRPLGTLSKGYICFSTDDGRHELSTYTVPMFIRKNVPLTMCIWSTSEVMTDSAEKAQIIAAITSPATAKYTSGPNAGQVINSNYSHSKKFEVAQHGNDPWADGILNAGRPDDGKVIHTPFDEKSLYDFWESENAAFAAQGITVAKSAACPYGYTNQRMIAQVGGYFGVHRSVYNPNDDNIIYYPYYCTGERSNIFALRAANIKGYSLPTWKAAVDYAIAKHYVLCIYFHDWDLSTTGRNDGITDDGGGTSLSAAARLEALIDYAKQQGITFCNLSDIPHLV